MQTPLPNDEPQKLTISRTKVGLVALLCVSAAIGLRFGLPNDDRKELWVTAFGRSGLVMTALWIALPAKGKSGALTSVTPSTALGALLAIIAVSARPQILLRLMPVFVALGVVAHYLRPKPKRRDERPDRSTWTK